MEYDSFFVCLFNWNKFDFLKIIQQPEDKQVTPPIQLQAGIFDMFFDVSNAV